MRASHGVSFQTEARNPQWKFSSFPFTSSMLLFSLLLFLQAFLVFPGTFIHTVTASGPALTTPVHHAIRFDRRVSGRMMSFGSHDSLLRGGIVLFAANDIPSHRRQTVYIPAERHVTRAQWEALMRLPVRGVIAAVTPHDTHNEKLIQSFLARGVVRFPIYFLPQDGVAAQKMTDVLTRLDPSEHAVITVGANERAVERTANTSITGVRLHASLNFKAKAAKTMSTNIPRVLITALFDTLGVAPSAKTTGGASGVAAALEIWRRFNVEASSAAAAASPFGVSLLLGNTARFNYVGTGNWVESFGEGEVDTYQLVICLDELLAFDADDEEESNEVEIKVNNNNNNNDKNGNNAPILFMHVHESFAKSPQYAVVKETAEAMAARYGIALTVVSAKTNYHHYDVRFEHEVLAHHQIPAVTFSTVRAYKVDQIFRGGRAPIPTAVVKKNTTIVDTLTTNTSNIIMAMHRRVNFLHGFAEALLGQPPARETVVWYGSAAYMMGLLRHAADSHRSPVSIESEGPLKYAEELETHIKHSVSMSASHRNFSTSVSVSTHPLKLSDIVLIGPYDQVLRLFVVKSLITEVSLMILALAAVGVFAFCELGYKKTLSVLFDTNPGEADKRKA